MANKTLKTSALIGDPFHINELSIEEGCRYLLSAIPVWKEGIAY